MKNIQFVIILLFFCVTGYSQATEFAVIDNKLIWENVFVADGQNISMLVERNSRLKIISSDGKVYKGVGSKVLYKCGENSATLRKGYNFTFEIELVEGKYRVTVSDITFNTKVKTTAEKHFMEAGKLKQDEVSVADMSCLQVYFGKVFAPFTTLKNKL